MDIANIGRYIKSVRKGLGFTQGDVAERLGISAQAVSKWERGENLPDVALFPELAKVLKINVGELLDALNPSDEQDEQNSSLENFGRLSAAQKTEIITAVLKTEDYALLLDEILPYAGAVHKQAILSHILNRRDYEELEQIAFYMTGEMKTNTLQKLLNEERLDIIEDIIPIFNRKHRDIIVEYFAASVAKAGLTEEVLEQIENFIPFFDKNQINRLKESIIKQEETK